uniref:One cut domain family member n=1 Tax=Panagrolaimus sp. ES5 TaxID=591445 RepID=A0AC34G4F0_9BILA
MKEVDTDMAAFFRMLPTDVNPGMNAHGYENFMYPASSYYNQCKSTYDELSVASPISPASTDETSMLDEYSSFSTSESSSSSFHELYNKNHPTAFSASLESDIILNNVDVDLPSNAIQYNDYDDAATNGFFFRGYPYDSFETSVNAGYDFYTAALTSENVVQHDLSPLYDMSLYQLHGDTDHQFENSYKTVNDNNTVSEFENLLPAIEETFGGDEDSSRDDKFSLDVEHENVAETSGHVDEENKFTHRRCETKVMVLTKDNKLVTRYFDEENMCDFAKYFHNFRTTWGFTQAEVGAALSLRYGTAGSQSTISRFEKFKLKHNNICNIRPPVEKWIRKVQTAIDNGILIDEIRRACKNGNIWSYVFPQDNNAENSELDLVLPIRPRRKRTRFTEKQIGALFNHFDQNQKPNQYEMTEIATSLGLNTKIVQIWFLNRRRKVSRK